MFTNSKDPKRTLKEVRKSLHSLKSCLEVLGPLTENLSSVTRRLESVSAKGFPLPDGFAVEVERIAAVQKQMVTNQTEIIATFRSYLRDFRGSVGETSTLQNESKIETKPTAPPADVEKNGHHVPPHSVNGGSVEHTNKTNLEQHWRPWFYLQNAVDTAVNLVSHERPVPSASFSGVAPQVPGTSRRHENAVSSKETNPSVNPVSSHQRPLDYSVQAPHERARFKKYRYTEMKINPLIYTVPFPQSTVPSSSCSTSVQTVSRKRPPKVFIVGDTPMEAVPVIDPMPFPQSTVPSSSANVQTVSRKHPRKVVITTPVEDIPVTDPTSFPQSTVHSSSSSTNVQTESRKRPRKLVITIPVEDIPVEDIPEKRRTVTPPLEVASATADVNGSCTPFECGCCFNDVPFESMVQCSEGHLFCIQCLQRYVHEAVYGGGTGSITCMTDGCDQTFPESQLKRGLPENLKACLEERIQQEQINMAELENFKRCTFCNCGAEVDENQQYFTCPNDECKRVSCIHCHVEFSQHIGLGCSEIEKEEETEIRREYEEKMASAKIRECPKCKMKFTKEEGCNKIICRCGTTMCYICRKIIKDYLHFCQHVRDPGKGCRKCNACKLYTNCDQDDDMAVREIKGLAHEARRIKGFEEKEIGVPLESKN